jgi:hypothetical protein
MTQKIALARRPPDIDDLCDRLNMKPAKIKAALRELQAKGFIVSTSPQEPDPIFNTWRLTMYPCDGKPATHDYLNPELVAKFSKPSVPRNGR